MVSKVNFDFQEHRGMCVSLGVLNSSDLRDRIAKGFIEKFPADQRISLCKLVYEAESDYVLEESGKRPERLPMKHYTISPVMDTESELVEAYNDIAGRLMTLNPALFNRTMHGFLDKEL